MSHPFATLYTLLSLLPNHPCNRRAALGLLGAAGLLPFLPACSSQPLRIAAHSWPGYELLYLARQEGWLSPKHAQLIETGSASESLQALQQGTADGAALTLDEVLTARANGLPLKIILVFDLSAGADMVMARPGISQIQQLAGKRIGVEPSAVGTLVLQLTLQAARLTEKQITIMPVTADKHLQAWQNQQLDAVITYEPHASLLQSKGAHHIYDSRSMPGMILDVLAIKSDLLRHHEAQAKALTATHFRALRHLQQYPDDAAHRMAERMKLTPLQVRSSFRGLELPSFETNQGYLGGSQPGLLAAARTISSLMVKTGLLKSPDTLAGLVSSRYLAHKES